MSSRSEGARAFTLRLAAIAAVGLVWRVVYVLSTRDDELLGDGVSYRLDAERLVEGSMPGAGHPPGWAFVLALPRAIGLERLVWSQLFTALVGVATIVVTGFAARRVRSDRVGLLAAAVAAAYPNVWLYERELLSEPLTMLWVAAMVWMAYWYRDEAPRWGPVLLGAMVGIGALVRSELLAVAPLVVVPLVVGRTPGWPRRAGALVASGLVCLAVLAPWAAFNATRFEEPVLLSTGLGPAMRQGNCPATYEGELLGYYKFGCVLFGDPPADYSEADGYWRRQALDHMDSDRGRAALVAVAREGRTFNVFRPIQQTELETERGSARWVTVAALLFYWALLPLAVAGVIALRRRGRPVYPLLAFPLLVAWSVLLTIGSVRYRVPAEIPLVILAAVGIDAMWGHLRPPPDPSVATS